MAGFIITSVQKNSEKSINKPIVFKVVKNRRIRRPWLEEEDKKNDKQGNNRSDV